MLCVAAVAVEVTALTMVLGRAVVPELVAVLAAAGWTEVVGTGVGEGVWLARWLEVWVWVLAWVWVWAGVWVWVWV